MREFENKVVIVTGATSGLGAAAAKSLAGKGARVALAGRREDRGAAIVAEIDGAGGEAMFVPTDVTRPADLEALVTRTTDRWGRLDGAVNNAGTPGGMMAPIADHPDDAWHAAIDTNLHSVFYGMKFQIPAMLASGGGSIVNMSSIWGTVGGDAGNCGYVASKWAVIGLTKTAAVDYGRQGIRVNALCPGACHSEMIDPVVDAAPEFVDRVVDRYSAMGRIGEAQEVANAIEFLLSDKASFISGAAIPVQGGEHSRFY